MGSSDSRGKPPTAVAFCVAANDNVAVLLDPSENGMAVSLLGERRGEGPVLTETIQAGHKVALKDIPEGGEIRRYGVTIGQATKNIIAGAWVHLHNCRSLFDQRSQALDLATGAPTDTAYE